MKQIVHIFRKDSRRFWPEILVSLAVMAMFAVIVPNEWRLSAGLSPETQTSTTLIGIVTLLLPLSWWLLIGRVIHAESLVGDNQHWLTRPYEWYNLLVAKLLFCVAYVCVPLLCAQYVLLGMAGFHPVGYTTGLLHSLNDTACILLLPMIVVAVVTSTFARMTLTTLGIMLGIVGLMLLAMWKGPTASAALPYDSDNSGWISFACFVCTCAATLIVQYATRRVWVARLLPIAFVLVIAVVEVAFATDRNVDRAYPKISGVATPLTLSPRAPEPDHPIAAIPMDDSKSIQLNVAVDASGVADGYAVEPNDVQVKIDGPGGLHTVVPWQNMYMSKILPGEKRIEIDFRVARAVFDRIKGSTVRLQLSFALTTFQAGGATRMTIPFANTPVPQLGYCSVETVIGEPTLSCRTAMRASPLTYATVPLTDGPCASPGTTDDPKDTGQTWLGSVNRGVAEAGMSPVKVAQHFFDLVDLSPEIGDVHRLRKLRLCPGRTITFSEYRLAGRARTELVVPEFAVPAEASGDAGTGAVSGIGIF